MKGIRDLSAKPYLIPSLFVACAVGLAVVVAPWPGRAGGDDAAPKSGDSRADASGVATSGDLANGAQGAHPFRTADESPPPLPAPPNAAAGPPPLPAPPNAAAGPPPLPAPPNAAAAPPPAAPTALSDKVAQENIFWDSVQKSNSLADYKAYLEAYPNGVFAPLARNRIAAMTPAAETAQPNPMAPAPPPLGPAQHLPGPPQPPPGAPQANAPQPEENAPGPVESGPGPVENGPGPAQNAPSAEALRAEVGTAETEQALNLNLRDARVLQERLAAQGLYSGPIDGDLGPGSRAAIAQWQQSHGMAPTGFLGPALLGALQAEGGPVNGERVGGQGCPPGFHAGRFGRRCWADR